MLDGRKMAELREKRGLTQYQLAVQAGLTIQTISMLENGRTNSPGLDTVAKIAQALGTPLTALLLVGDSNAVFETRE